LKDIQKMIGKCTHTRAAEGTLPAFVVEQNDSTTEPMLLVVEFGRNVSLKTGISVARLSQQTCVTHPAAANWNQTKHF
jgi:hypothetical protein